MSATAEQTTPQTDSLDDAYDALTTALAATPEPGPDRASGTPADEPDAAPADSDEAAPEAPPTGDQRTRDERGRFVPKAGEAPAAATPPAGDAPPLAGTSAAEQPADPQGEEDLAAQVQRLQRQLETQRGQVQNAAQQAAERARQEAEARYQAEAKQRARQAITQQLEAMLASGQVSQEQAVAAYQDHQQRWQQEDAQEAQEALTRREAGVKLSGVQAAGQQALVGLYNQGVPRLAQDFGLDEAEVRDLWADEGERARFQRAVWQARLADEFPGLPFNKAAAEDYLATTQTHLRHVRAVHDRYRAALAEKDQELERLRVQLNRDEAGGGLPDPAPGRGGARRAAPATLEEAGSELDRILRANPHLLRS